MSANGVWRVGRAAIVAAVLAVGCGSADSGQPTSNSTSASSSTSSTSSTSVVAPTTTQLLQGAGGSISMNISDDYEFGDPSRVDCDGAMNVIMRTLGLPSLTPEDSPQAYATALQEARAALVELAAVAKPELSAQAAGMVILVDGISSEIAGTADVAYIRSVINRLATADGTNAGTLLVAIEADCPMVLQGAVAPTELFG